MEKSREDAGQLKNVRFDWFQETLFVLDYLSCGFSKLEVICSGDRGRSSNLTKAATALMSINARDDVSQTFCIRER